MATLRDLIQETLAVDSEAARRRAGLREQVEQHRASSSLESREVANARAGKRTGVPNGSRTVSDPEVVRHPLDEAHFDPRYDEREIAMRRLRPWV